MPGQDVEDPIAEVFQSQPQFSVAGSDFFPQLRVTGRHFRFQVADFHPQLVFSGPDFFAYLGVAGGQPRANRAHLGAQLLPYPVQFAYDIDYPVQFAYDIALRRPRL